MAASNDPMMSLIARSEMFSAEPSKRVLKVSTAHEYANPAPLGLYGFAITTALLQGAVTGISGAETVTWATSFAIGYGGLGQIIAGLIDFRRNNMFGGCAFTTYGVFWWSFVAYQILVKAPSATVGKPLLPPSIDGEAFMLAFMGCITAAFAICTFTMNWMICNLFCSLSLLFFLLTGGLYSHGLHQAAGWFGLYVAAVAFYIGSAELINHTYNKTCLPLFPRRKLQHLAGASPDPIDLPGQLPNKYRHGEDKDLENGNRVAVVP